MVLFIFLVLIFLMICIFHFLFFNNVVVNRALFLLPAETSVTPKQNWESRGGFCCQADTAKQTLLMDLLIVPFPSSLVAQVPRDH